MRTICILEGAWVGSGRSIPASKDFHVTRAIGSALAAFLFLGAAQAAEAPADDIFVVTIKDHRFNPAEVVVPAGRKVKLKVVNADPTPEEFESHELNREKVIPGNTSTIVFIGPLDAGTYPFFGEFNQATAQGRIIAK
jgi:plastocyanin